MPTPKYKFIVPRGEDSDKEIQWKDHVGTPIPLTGYVVECILYKDASEVFHTMTTANGDITVVPLEGKFTLIFDSDLTMERLTPYSRYEIWFTSPDNRRKKFMAGSLVFSDE